MEEVCCARGRGGISSSTVPACSCIGISECRWWQQQSTSIPFLGVPVASAATEQNASAYNGKRNVTTCRTPRTVIVHLLPDISPPQFERCVSYKEGRAGPGRPSWEIARTEDGRYARPSLSHRPKILLYLTTHLSQSHIKFLRYCWPTALSRSRELRQADVLVFDTSSRNQGEEDRDAAMDIVASIMSFLSSIGGMMQRDNDGENSDILAIPEIYDIIVHILSLLLVLLSTQLYQPMVGQQSNNLFLEKIMQYATWQNQQQQAQNLPGEADTLQNEPLMFLHVCLQWLTDRPQPPHAATKRYNE